MKAEVETVIPIQLPAGDVRTALNLKDNTTNIGKEVLVYGNIATYCGVTGIKNTSEYEFTGNSVTIITAINTIEADKAQDGVIYNLAGQKVDNSYKGLIIKNGKKMLQK